MKDNFSYGKGIFGIDMSKVTKIEKHPELDFAVCFFFNSNSPYIIIPCGDSKTMQECYMHCSRDFKSQFKNVIDFMKYKRRT